MINYKPEQIVKFNLPIVGTYIGKEVDVKNRIVIPKKIRDTYRIRQNKEEDKECHIFIGNEKYPKVAILTDNIKFDFEKYYLINFDSQGRILLPKALDFNLPENRKVDLIGRGDSLEIRASNSNHNSSTS